ncbi:alpha/beta hydrolase [Paenibacillus sp. SC116]|uniref:alpha/beta fold hydrolase n=1 Tax=Paenibacillus sp. SC116 TaxID=2968986 RepID=UPI00215B3B3B|nr:alpha/beta hydrolase [Paenibacillus sp. SC116]MCR8842325.1 alpha/beta hydrolase [Paenibacillus sp. SC116]
MEHIVPTIKKKNKIWKVTRNTVVVIAVILVSWIAFHHAISAYERSKHPAPGEIVEVDGKNMHVYSKGQGEHTIVLLPGLGTTAPALDFEPFMNEMAKNNKVVVVEPFGYGWSDQTSKERTVENMVEEIRTALKNANIEGPYILMPHSVSGIYSMYYANQYPNEVAAIIGNDITLPQALDYFNEPAPSMPTFMSMFAPTGVTRLLSYVSPNQFLPEAGKGTYSDENLAMTALISAWKGANKNVVNEANGMANNILKTKKMSFAPNLPVMIFARERKDKTSVDGRTNLTFYESQLSNSVTSKLIPLEGHHYLHWTNYKEMADHVNRFIDTFERNS